MANQKYFLVDVETSGTDSRTHDIIEIAYMTFELGPEGVEQATNIRVQRFLPRPDAPVDPKAFAVNGYYPGHPDWTGAMEHGTGRAEQFWRDVVRQTEGTIIAGHRVGFDKSFILRTLEREGLTPQWHHYRTFDTGPLATLITAAHGEPPASLENAYKLLGGKPVVAHRAAVDVMMTFELIKYGFHVVKNARSLV